MIRRANCQSIAPALFVTTVNFFVFVTVKYTHTFQQISQSVKIELGVMEVQSKQCLYCGTELPITSQLVNRKYCGITCKNKYKLRQKKPCVQAKLWQHEPEVFESAMEMYWQGYGGAAIAYYLGISVNTAYSWIHDFGEQRERCASTELPAIIRPAIKSRKDLFRDAESDVAWYNILRENASTNAESFEDVPIRLVCGVLHGQSAGKLAGVISDRLKENPLSGRSYAFCSKGRNTVTVIAWKSPVYVLSKYVKAHGTFIWPHENLGETIEVTRAEFEALLFMNKYEKTAKTLDVMRF